MVLRSLTEASGRRTRIGMRRSPSGHLATLASMSPMVATRAMEPRVSAVTPRRAASRGLGRTISSGGAGGGGGRGAAGDDLGVSAAAVLRLVGDQGVGDQGQLAAHQLLDLVGGVGAVRLQLGH